MWTWRPGDFIFCNGKERFFDGEKDAQANHRFPDVVRSLVDVGLREVRIDTGFDRLWSVLSLQSEGDLRAGCGLLRPRALETFAPAEVSSSRQIS